jgi:hypothetical protein
VQIVVREKGSVAVRRKTNPRLVKITNLVFGKDIAPFNKSGKDIALFNKSGIWQRHRALHQVLSASILHGSDCALHRSGSKHPPTNVLLICALHDLPYITRFRSGIVFANNRVKPLA